jgi:hypothetical protein
MTRWTLVIATGDAQGKEARSQLVSLCEKNWYAFVFYLRRRRYPADQAGDLTQALFIRARRAVSGSRRPGEGRVPAAFLDLFKIFCGRRTRPASVSLSSDSSLTPRCETANNRHGRL